MRNIFILVFIFSIFFKVKAQNTQKNTDSLQISPKKVTYLVGTGIGLAPRYEGSDNYFLLPSLVFSANWITGQYLRLSVGGIEANISKDRKWEFGPKLRFTIPRNDTFIKNDEVNSLATLDLSLLAGAFGRYRFAKKFDIKAEYTQDISSVSDGGLGILELGYTSRVNRWILNYAITTSFATENYMDTYFGINTNSIGNSTLPFYKAKAGFKDIGFRLTETYAINQHWLLTYSLGYRHLIGDAGNSPIVKEGSRNQFVGGIIAMYRL